MAKKSKVVDIPSVNRDLLAAIGSGAVAYATKDEAISAGLTHDPAYVEANITMIDPSNPAKAAIRITDAGKTYLNGNGSVAPKENNTVENFSVITNAVLPPSKRGSGLGGGAPVKYPFDKLEVGGSFFVPVSDKLPNPVKTLGSTVSSANMRYASETGETKTVTRAKRSKGNKLELDAAGNKIMETKQVPVYKFTRKFEIRGVEANKKYGEWTAPHDGALIQRTA